MTYHWIVRCTVLSEADELRCIDSPPLTRLEAAKMLARLNTSGISVLEVDCIRADLDALDTPAFPLLLDLNSRKPVLVTDE